MRSFFRTSVVAMVILAVAISGQCRGTEAKSMRRALLLSLLAPGAGQAYLGDQGRARLMLVSEGATWATFTVFRVQGRMRQERYKEMARLFAGIEGERDDDYYLALANYISSEEYNIDVMREARLLFTDRESQIAYFFQNGYFGADAWEWQSVKKQQEFSNTRLLSKRSYRRAVLTTGFAVLNRMVSMIDIYLSFRLGRHGERRSSVGLRADHGSNGGFRLYISAPF